MQGDLEQLAHESALRALDKQERLLEELRARTGILLAASSLAASFLGDAAFGDSGPVGLAVAALLAFIVSTGASVYVLAPKRDLIFSLSGPGLYEGLYEFRDDLVEVHRRLAYDLHRFWESNDHKMTRLIHAYRAAAVALVLEILLLVALVGDTII
jgi:tetrahydromethanopterin S-methyltransferase subunit B